MVDIILIMVILLVVGIAGGYIYKQKKNGNHCIGCPNSKTCNSNKCNCK